jgi:hypothetical protein
VKTIPFEEVILSKDSVDRIVPAHGSRLFFGLPDVNMVPKVVHLATAKKDASLRATLLLQDHSLAEIAEKSIPVGRGGAVEGARIVAPCDHVMLRVDNLSDEPIEVQPSIFGMMSTLEFGSKKGKLEEGWILVMEPKPNEARIRRLVVAPGGQSALAMSFPCVGKLARITTRSDSELDVSFQELRVANVSLFGGAAALPVEFFRDGFDIRAMRVTPANRLSVVLHNRSTKERYVEIDLGITPNDPNQGESATRS